MTKTSYSKKNYLLKCFSDRAPPLSHDSNSVIQTNVWTVPHCPLDDRGTTRRDTGQGSDSKEYCSPDKDIVEVVRTEYVYTRPPPWSDVLPTIHVITPTYSRPVQKAELTRLANTFLHVPNLHWILVEDSQRQTPLVNQLLRETGLNYTHLNVETPRNYKLRGTPGTRESRAAPCRGTWPCAGSARPSAPTAPSRASCTSPTTTTPTAWSCLRR